MPDTSEAELVAHQHVAGRECTGPRRLLDERGLRIVHIDAVVISEQPRLGPHFLAMRKALARALETGLERINLKAKTHEGLGELGRSEAIAAHAIATVEG